jgi:hypothetical protein
MKTWLYKKIQSASTYPRPDSYLQTEILIDALQECKRAWNTAI